MKDDFVVSAGGPLKSLSDSGKVGGYLVLTGPEYIDLDREYFSTDCDFWLEGKSLIPMLFDHGRSEVFKRRRITHVRVEKQDAGVWIEGKLPIRESSEVEQLWESVKRDELGLSSGTSEHLMERVRRGNVTEIVSWPISEASLAPRPAQPKSRAVALKSLPRAEFDLYADPEERARQIYEQLDALVNETRTPEQRAAEVYAQSLMRMHELRMQSLTCGEPPGPGFRRIN
jgi:hypothetical protein